AGIVVDLVVRRFFGALGCALCFFSASTAGAGPLVPELPAVHRPAAGHRRLAEMARRIQPVPCLVPRGAAQSPRRTLGSVRRLSTYPITGAGVPDCALRARF